MAVGDGSRRFLTVWLGQTVSVLGSGLTGFVMGVWVLQETGSVTAFTLIAVSASVPGVLLAPLVGVLVDRYDRRLMMIVGDAGAAAATAALVVLLVTGRLEVWHLYVVAAVSSAFGTIQFPAFSAAITLLVPKDQLGRASGMVQLGEALARILAPLLAGLMLARIAVAGVVALDLVTFLFAVGTLLAVRIPRPPPAAAEEAAVDGRAWWRQAAFGWSYIRRRPGLVALLAYFATINLLVPMALVLAAPLVLGFAGPAELGVVQALGGLGLLAGGVAMAVWGGPRRRVAGILGFAPLVTVGMVVAGLRPSVPLIATGQFVTFATFPVLNACSQAIWQSKVEPAVQGRVFAIRGLMAQCTAPVGFLLAGPLADRLFEPLLATDSPFAGGPVARLFGIGTGRGVGLLFAVMGLLFLLATAAALASRRLRDLEDELPDAVSEPPLGDVAGGP